MKNLELRELIDGQLLVQPGAWSTLGKVGCRMVLSVEYPFGGQQTLDADWAACMDPGRGYAHLGAQAEPEAVRETRARIVEHTGAVHAAKEMLCRGICTKWKTENVKCQTKYEIQSNSTNSNMQYAGVPSAC